MSSRAYEPLSAQDSSFVTFERRATHMHIGAVAILEAGPLRTADGGIDTEVLSKYIESRLHLLPRYRQKLAFTPLGRRPIWIDDPHFNLRYHVRHTSLPRPGSDQKLKDLAGRILSQHLDRTKPLWEIWLVEGLSGGRFAAIGKVHHSILDGAGGVSLLTLLLRPSPDGRVEPAPLWMPRPPPSPLRLLADEGLRQAKLPFEMLRRVRRGLREPRQALAALAERSGSVLEFLGAGLRRPGSTPFNRPIGPHRRFDWHEIDLDRVGALRRRLDGTVNDVILAVVAGALRRFLLARGARLRGLDYRVIIPVNMRRPDEAVGATNRVSALFLSLPVEEADPHRRFGHIRRETRKLKESKAREGVALFTDFADWSGSTLLMRAGVALASRVHPYNLIVTNVPGPQTPFYLLGARLMEIYPQLPLFENQGLGVAVMSYRGKVCWGLLGDWDLVPDLASFSASIEASVEELEAVAASRSDA
jgi:WS/DGAT/MGAT family acyltransferase